ncbi:MAG: hypothetical protein JXB38_07100 [Anaerolineales bacterium]|nr:hypothetical protein [Anaerolineales bacterium]
MKTLSKEAFKRAANYINTQARPLERALFSYHFEDGDSQLVLAELAHFLNQDGGFGKAFEPDMRSPSSSALATGHALTLLKELDCPADHPMVKEVVHFLRETLDEETLVWRIVPQDVNQYPHAPWWHDEDGSLARTFDDFVINPRAQILSLLYHYNNVVPSKWLKTLSAHTVAAAQNFQGERLGGEGIIYLLQLAKVEDLPEADKEIITERVMKAVGKEIARDPAAWASYSVNPLKLAPRPDSILAEMLWEDIQVNLDYVIETQTDAGSWEPNWTWGDLYPDVWPLAKKEWSGHITLENLLTLRAYGRIAGA